MVEELKQVTIEVTINSHGQIIAGEGLVTHKGYPHDVRELGLYLWDEMDKGEIFKLHGITEDERYFRR